MENNNSPLLFNQIQHSVQMYWRAIASALYDVLTQLTNTNQLDVATIIALNNAITAAERCAELYGDIIRVPIEERHTNRIAQSNYENTEIVFYNQLIGLLLNIEVHNLLHNIVQRDVDVGTRYFQRFLMQIGVDYN